MILELQTERSHHIQHRDEQPSTSGRGAETLNVNDNVGDQPPPRTEAQNLILDAEKFKAAVEQPKGITNV